ncbi:hypothetical protein GOBAR_AA23335 [Gossypium barbadense]|uniref:Uncharacterized protein n=1 Tax=Gossypium barbadense TaxID=3634 RepID=A0A2P5X1Y5_GOSBA|nr:hypothetical protein GOBAR_AA23335 [Gossypium barbadense]
MWGVWSNSRDVLEQNSAIGNVAGTTLRAPQHRDPRIIPHSHWPDVSTRHLEHAYHEDDQEASRNLPSPHEDPPTQPPPPSRPVHAAASYADISERLTRFEHKHIMT